jgi:hypothetical protein
MKQSQWYIVIAVSLLLVSLTSYLTQILIFHRTEDTFFYMMQDFAFVPVQVLLVTVILNALLGRREKRSFLNKLNMVIGVFFSEAGIQLLSLFSAFDANRQKIVPLYIINATWTPRDFARAKRLFKAHEYAIDSRMSDLKSLKIFLLEKRALMLSLLENPNLIEHGSFTDLLWAVFHLTQELEHRKDLDDLPETDYEHLSGDLQRAYLLLIMEWLDYVHHLKQAYPYIFSLAVRTNPFDMDATVEVR